MGCGVGRVQGVNRGREGRLAQGHGVLVEGWQGAVESMGILEHNCVLKPLPPSLQKADDMVCL